MPGPDFAEAGSVTLSDLGWRKEKGVSGADMTWGSAHVPHQLRGVFDVRFSLGLTMGLFPGRFKLLKRSSHAR